MITLNLRDEKLEENIKAIGFLQKTGLYTEEQLQQMYDKQIEKDASPVAKGHSDVG